MAQNPEATAGAESVCRACGQAVHSSGAVDCATVIGGRVPTEIVIARLDAKVSAAVQRAYEKAGELAGRSSAISRASDTAEERLRETIEAAETIAEEAREQLAELAGGARSDDPRRARDAGRAARPQRP